MQRPPFQIFPWQMPFIPNFKTFLDQDTAGQPGSAVIIVPHKRPWRYLEKLYKDDGKSRILPKMLTFSEVISLWTANSENAGRLLSTGFEQIALLRQCCREAAENDTALANKIARMNLEQFLPWGQRLARLLEEIFSNGMDPADHLYAEGEVSDTAAALLGSLGKICERWLSKMNAAQLTTPGLDAWFAAKKAGELPPFLMPSLSRPVYIAGFYALDGVQKKIFKSLWQNGAKICLHTDPAVAEQKNVHYHCREHVNWLKKWRAAAELAIEPEAAADADISYRAGYDIHSQLSELRKLLDQPAKENTVIALPSPDLLMPVLHHLEENVNISMGYPIGRTQLANLISDLFILAETRSPDGLYHVNELLKFIRQPYIKLLPVINAAGNGAGQLRSALIIVEKLLTEEHKYVDLNDLLEKARQQISPEAANLLADIFKIFIADIASAASMASLAAALENICNFFVSRGQAILAAFPLDTETLDRIANKFIPALADNDLSQEALPTPALRALLLELFDQENLAFEDDPLNGIQILGLLETRMLTFDNVFILNATDEVLPGNIAQDPLLPDSLRPWFQLPTGREKKAAIVHNIFRLCAGAKKVNFFWQEGISQSELFSSKNMRSPIIEEFIWQDEEREQKLLKAGEGKLQVSSAKIHTQKPALKSLPNTGAVKQQFDKFIKRPLSPSKLDLYFVCPLRFVNECLLGLHPAQENSEDDNPMLVGTIIHKALFNTLAPYLNKQVDIGKEITLETLCKNMFAAMREYHADKNLSPKGRAMLELAMPVRFGAFLDSQKVPTHILALEKEFNSSLNTNGIIWKLKGKLDRVDQRNDKLYLLDYKTGSLNNVKIKNDLWKDSTLFENLKNWSEARNPSPDSGEDLLGALREKVPTIQLPCYITLLKADKKYSDLLIDAAYVDLGDSGAEKPLFGEKTSNPALQKGAEDCAVMINFVIQQLANTENFTAHPGRYCDWCAYSALCKA